MANIPKIQSAHNSEARNIINALIERFNSMGYTYDQAMAMAQDILDEAQQVNAQNADTNERLDNIIADSGTSSTEVVDARGSHTILGSRLDSIDNNFEQIDQNIRRSYMYNRIYGVSSEYTKPPIFELSLPANISISENGEYHYDYDVSKHKNVVSKRYYVDVENGDNMNDGSESSPFETLGRAFRAGDADEIILKSGYYGWAKGIEGAGTIGNQKKNFNLIGDGDVFVGAHRDRQNWSAVPDKNNVFMTTATAVVEVVDINDGYDSPVFYKEASNLDEVGNTSGSFFIDADDVVYVHPNYNGEPNEKVLLNMGTSAWYLGDHGKVYVENIKFTNTVTFDTSVPAEFYAKSVDFGFGTGDNSLSILGDIYFEFQYCRAVYAERDGFNYHLRNGKVPKGWEFECKGEYNGRDGANQNNGSSMHGGGIIGRIGGEHHHNNGPNVIDVSDGTQSLNIGVHAHNSSSTYTNRNVDFRTRDDTDMWLINCISHSSDFSTSVEEPARLHVENSLLLSPEENA